MRVGIVGGRSRADYLMGALAETVDTVVAINDDRRFCEYLSSRHDGTVIWGNGMKLAVLEEAGVAEVEDFVLWCDKFGAANNMSFTVVVSEDPEKATEAMKAYL